MAGQAKIPFRGISTGKLRRYFDLKNFTDFFKVPLGFLQSLKILGEEKPDLLFAKGGYVSVPVVAAARLLGIPVWLHESDVTPGLSTKICLRFASKIWLSFEESKKYFHGKRIEVVGNPIRKMILNGNREKGFLFTGFSDKKPVVLIMGGSTGAQSLNKIIYEILPDLLKEAQVIHITGPPAKRGATSHRGYKQFEFLDEELADCYAISDLIVSRAGSGGIFEILALRKPMLLIPLPKTASRGDQIENAEVFSSKGFAISVDQEKITPLEFLETIKNLLCNEMLRKRLTENQGKVDFSRAAGIIAQEMLRTSQTA